jgi:hypothetical protein
LGNTPVLCYGCIVETPSNQYSKFLLAHLASCMAEESERVRAPSVMEGGPDPAHNAAVKNMATLTARFIEAIKTQFLMEQAQGIVPGGAVDVPQLGPGEVLTPIMEMIEVDTDEERAKLIADYQKEYGYAEVPGTPETRS